MTDESRSRTRQWLFDLFVHDTAEKMRVARAAMALGYGLDPIEYARPFPGSSVNIVMNETHSTNSKTPTPPSHSRPTWPLMLLAAALGAIGVWFAKPSPSPTPALDPKLAPAHKEIEIVWRIENGQLKTDIRQLPDVVGSSDG